VIRTGLQGFCKLFQIFIWAIRAISAGCERKNLEIAFLGIVSGFFSTQGVRGFEAAYGHDNTLRDFQKAFVLIF
jgi:hypothetical protein